MDESIDLLFEIREALEECRDLPIELLARIVNHTNAVATRSKLRSTGDAHRDRLVAAALDVRSES
jgi:hypothetical protein